MTNKMPAAAGKEEHIARNDMRTAAFGNIQIPNLLEVFPAKGFRGAFFLFRQFVIGKIVFVRMPFLVGHFANFFQDCEIMA